MIIFPGFGNVDVGEKGFDPSEFGSNLDVTQRLGLRLGEWPFWNHPPTMKVSTNQISQHTPLAFHRFCWQDPGRWQISIYHRYRAQIHLGKRWKRAEREGQTRLFCQSRTTPARQNQPFLSEIENTRNNQVFIQNWDSKTSPEIVEPDIKTCFCLGVCMNVRLWRDWAV